MARFNFSTGRKPISAFSLASLTDIVLLLLIFFLLSSSFVTQYGLRVNLPDVSAAAPLEQEYVAVSVEADGSVTVDDTPVAPDSLEATLAALKGDRTALAVYADRDARIGILAQVAAAASALDLRVAIATDASGSTTGPAAGSTGGSTP